MSIPTADTRPYYPNIQKDIPSGIIYAQFLETKICDWNLKISIDGDCTAAEILPIHMYVNWLTTTYEETKEVISDGFGGEQVVLKKIQPVFEFQTFCSEAILDAFYRMSAASVIWELETNDDLPVELEIYDLSVSHTEIAPKVYRVNVTFKSMEEGEAAFGITGCCRALYEEAPYEDPCDPIDNENCSEVEAFTEFKTSGNTLSLPELPDEVLAVFKDNIRLREGSSFLGYTVSGSTITLSEAVSTNNPDEGEEIHVLYKV